MTFAGEIGWRGLAAAGGTFFRVRQKYVIHRSWLKYGKPIAKLQEKTLLLTVIVKGVMVTRMAQSRILSVRLAEQVGGVGVTIEFGSKEVQKQIPAGQGILRMSVILDENNELFDAEIVTTKI